MRGFARAAGRRLPSYVGRHGRIGSARTCRFSWRTLAYRVITYLVFVFLGSTRRINYAAALAVCIDCGCCLLQRTVLDRSYLLAAVRAFPHRGTSPADVRGAGSRHTNPSVFRPTPTVGGLLDLAGLARLRLLRYAVHLASVATSAVQNERMTANLSVNTDAPSAALRAGRGSPVTLVR